MRARSTRFGAVVAAAAALSWNVAASGQHLYQVKENTIGCASPRAAAALSGSDPRRSDPNWVRSVMNDGGCLVVTPASRWALVRFGQDFLVRNLVPGDGRELYISAYELSEIFPATPSPAAAKPVTPRGQETFTVGRVGHANRSLTLRKMADGRLDFSLDEWTDGGDNFAVSGVADRVGGAWQYREKMASPDPDARCAVNIVPRPDGGYDVSTLEGARCEAYAGHNATLYGTDTFPRSARAVIEHKGLARCVGEPASRGRSRDRCGNPWREPRGAVRRTSRRNGADEEDGSVCAEGAWHSGLGAASTHTVLDGPYASPRRTSSRAGSWR